MGRGRSGMSVARQQQAQAEAERRRREEEERAVQTRAEVRQQLEKDLRKFIKDEQKSDFGASRFAQWDGAEHITIGGQAFERTSFDNKWEKESGGRETTEVDYRSTTPEERTGEYQVVTIKLSRRKVKGNWVTSFGGMHPFRGTRVW